MRHASVDDDAEKRQRRIALAITLLLNMGFIVIMSRLMTVHPPVAVLPTNDFMLLRLIDPPAGPAVPAPAPFDASPDVRPAAALRAPRSHANRVASTSTAPAAVPLPDVVQATPAAASASTEPLKLFAADGTTLVPPGDGAPSVKAFPTRPRSADSELFVHRSPLQYTPTRLEKAWSAPINETLGGEMFRKAIVSRSWRTPWGTQVSCAWVIIVGTCGWGYVTYETIDEMKRERADPPMSKGSPQIPLVTLPATPLQ